LCFFVLL